MGQFLLIVNIFSLEGKSHLVIKDIFYWIQVVQKQIIPYQNAREVKINISYVLIYKIFEFLVQKLVFSALTFYDKI